MNRLALCCGLAMLGATMIVSAAESLRIVPLVDQKQVLVTLQMSEAYGEDVRETIASGLRTTFTYDLELRMSVAGWVDRTVATAVITLTDEYDNLTRRHRLTRLVDGRTDEAIVTEDEAVVKRWLTTVNRLPLCATAKLERNRDYYVRVSVRKRPQRDFPFPWSGPITGQAKFTFIP
jgi:hypothetical protein